MNSNAAELPDIDRLRELVRSLAERELMTHFGCCDYEYKDDGSVVTRADIAMQTALESELAAHWPQIDMLGEEMESAAQQEIVNRSTAYWCIDPLDGTSNFSAGIPVFAVSVALVIDGMQELGLIYDPVRDEMFSAVRGEGAWLNGKRLQFRPENMEAARPVIAEIDLKRLPVEMRMRLVSENIFSSQRNVGSSAIDWAWLAAGRFDIYLHGGQKMWDYAAGSLILAEAGGKAISFDGEAVFRGRLEKRSALGGFEGALFDRWYDWLGLPLV